MRSVAGKKTVEQSNARRCIFLLSPANLSGKRGRWLLSGRPQFDVAKRLRRGEATLGEVFAFISGLYFRGKLAYAQAFADPPADLPSALIITAGQGLASPETLMNRAQLKRFASVPVDLREPRYLRPLMQHCRALGKRAGDDCRFVLLGSIATPKYIQPMSETFGERLCFPEEFIGRGDLSRGGLLLRCVRDATSLRYVSVSTLGGFE